MVIGNDIAGISRHDRSRYHDRSEVVAIMYSVRKENLRKKRSLDRSGVQEFCFLDRASILLEPCSCLGLLSLSLSQGLRDWRVNSWRI